MANLSPGILIAWQTAAQEAARSGHAMIGRGHLFLGITSVEGLLDEAILAGKSLADLDGLKEEVSRLASLFREHGLDPGLAARHMRRMIDQRREVLGPDGLLHRSTACRAVFARTRKLALASGSQPHLMHLWSALLEQPGMELAQALVNSGRDLQILQADASRALADLKLPIPVGHAEKRPAALACGILEQFGTDLTRQAREGKIERLVGRSRELLQLARTLSRKSKNNPILLGDPGVGKTAIVRNLAQRISEGNVPRSLRGARLVELNLGALVAGTKYRGEFEERLSALLVEVKQDPNLILFLDEIHTLIKAGGPEGGLDAANMLKPILAGTGIRLIGSTTHAEYTRYLERDAALVRRFQPIVVEAPSPNETYAILIELKESYESHHQVRIVDSALKAAVELAQQYLPERNFPDKALDLIDEACARAKIASAKFGPGEDAPNEAYRATIDEETVADVVAEWTGIPVPRLTAANRERLQGMEAFLGARVLGQGAAIEAVTRLVTMARAGFMGSERPAGVLLFIGPSGTGKTALCRALAEYLFGTTDALIRLDMTEYQEHGALNRMIGAPPGYLGHDEEGQLTGRLRRKPHAVVVIEEIDKAPTEALDLFCQIFGEGRLKDAKGHLIDCRHTLFVMTYNKPIKDIKSNNHIGFAEHGTAGKEQLGDQNGLARRLGHTLNSQILSRADEIILFNPIGRQDLEQIAIRMVKPVIDAMGDREIELTVNDDFIARIALAGADKARGVHPMARTIDQLLKAPLSKLLLNEELTPGAKVGASFRDGKTEFTIEKVN